jgi:hypothetical protein
MSDLVVTKVTNVKTIGLIGPIGCGKDTLADYFTLYKFTKLSFASKLKDVLSIVFGWDRNNLEGITPESREWREQVDPYWNISPRMALQKVGTDMFRNFISQDVWVKSISKEIDKLNENNQPVVITDCRFLNEAELIKEKNGLLLYIQRDKAEEQIPEWIKREAKDALFNPNSKTRQTIDQYCIQNNIHPTNWMIYGLKHLADIVILNNGSIEEFINDVKKLDIMDNLESF